MNHVLLLLPLLLVVSVPVAFGETVETKGENYDLIEDFTLGEATWVSHPDRIMNGQWENYALTDSEDKVIFNSNSVGSLIFDKNSCSYSIYENGFVSPQTQIIPSVSAMASFQDSVGVWSNLPVNNQACVVEVIPYDDGVFLTSTKVMEDDKFVQELDLNINSGFKETFKVWHTGDHSLGISQTVHTGESIIVGETVIPIAQYSGQSFDRTFIIDNEAEILQLTDNINYDFDEGIKSLSNVNIIFDETSTTYKVNLDYANGDNGIPFMGYLEIDPTFAYTSGTGMGVAITGATGTACPSGTKRDQAVTTHNIYLRASNLAYTDSCIVGGEYWDVSSISDSVTVSQVNVRYDVSVGSNARTCTWQEITGTLSTDGYNANWVDITTGTEFVNADANCQTTANDYTLDLGANAVTRFNSFDLADNEFGVGFRQTSMVRDGSVHNLSIGDVELQVTYALPSPDPPTGLSITTQSIANQLTLTWTAPTGGITPDGYKIGRSVDGGSWNDSYVADTTTTAITYDNSGLSPDTSYAYRVWSLSGATASTSYASVAGTTTWNVPSQVGTVTGTADITPDLSWSAPSSDGALTNYKIYRDGTLHDTISASATTYSDSTSVVVGSTYAYTVSGVSAVGEGAQSVSINVVAGVSPDPPTGLTSTIQDPNNSPLDVFLQFSSPTNIGSGTLTGFEVWKNGSLLTTLGLVNSYTDTVTVGSHSFYVKSISTHGTSIAGNTASITTPTIPGTITDLSGSVISDTKINLSFSIPNNGGSNIIDYDILKDGVTIATVTTNSYSSTGLTPNTQYTFEVFSRNNVGYSLISNQAIETTYQSVSGSVTITTDTQGATTELTFAPSGVTGTPTPNFNLFTLKEGVNVIASGITSPYYLAHDNFNSNTYTVTSTDNTHWNNPTITGSSTVQSDYSPSWNTANVSYNYTRTSGVMDLMVNKDNSQNTWDASCNYRTTSEVMDDQPGITSNHTGVWYVSESQTLADIDTVYVSCVDGEDALFSFTSFGPNRLGGGIAQLDDFFGGMTGTPVALIFVLLVAGLFTGRTAPTGILVMLALIGVLGFIGLLTLDEAVWGFLLLAGVLGIFLGKRFL